MSKLTATQKKTTTKALSSLLSSTENVKEQREVIVKILISKKIKFKFVMSYLRDNLMDTSWPVTEKKSPKVPAGSPLSISSIRRKVKDGTLKAKDVPVLYNQLNAFETSFRRSYMKNEKNELITEKVAKKKSPGKPNPLKKAIERVNNVHKTLTTLIKTEKFKDSLEQDTIDKIELILARLEKISK